MKLPQINIKNRRAAFDYELLDTYTAGIVLTGTEIKSIRLGKAGLSDTFCYFNNGELWVKNMYIAEYFYGTYNPSRPETFAYTQRVGENTETLKRIGVFNRSDTIAHQ